MRTCKKNEEGGLSLFKQYPEEVFLYGKADAQKPVDCLPHQGFSEECKESVSEFIQ